MSLYITAIKKFINFYENANINLSSAQRNQSNNSINLNNIRNKIKNDLLAYINSNQKDKLNEKLEKANSILNEIFEGYSRLDYNVYDITLKSKTKFITGTREGFLYQIFEVGMAWDPILDLPYIPGSTLKGILRSYALSLCKNTECVESALRIFGIPIEDKEVAKLLNKEKIKGYIEKNGNVEETSVEGLVIVTDAYPIKVSDSLLTPDIINPHYYKGGRVVKNELEVEPVPIVYFAVSPNVTFRFIIATTKEAEDEIKKLTKMIFNSEMNITSLILLSSSIGLGAKTSIGYGEFSYEVTSTKIYQGKKKRGKVGMIKLEGELNE